MKEKYPELEAKMKKTIDLLSHELSTIRAGRASASILDKVTVDYYGAATPIIQIASITIPEPRMLVISRGTRVCLKISKRPYCSPISESTP